ncbi:hypothetical protein ASC82_14985 [Streptomyces sp. Root431]|uniref:hypothetical protein n=1 Tax=Streptomyces sp. Root431 TaxID=1736535 RepID=UPI0006FB2FD5|nr:hypothetical protein [Streptomyces sp. Root431]KQX12499.1 hypothetical protein ASC82_14985 [Streptomyces sp. Root431]
MRNRMPPLAADLVLIAVVAATVVALPVWDGRSSGQGAPFGSAGRLAVAGAAVAAVLVRRRRPATALVAAATLLAFEPLTGGALTVVAYTAGLAWAGLRHRLLVLAVSVTVPLAVAAARSAVQPARTLAYDLTRAYDVTVVLAAGIVCGVLPGLAGALAAQRGRLVRALEERDAFLEVRADACDGAEVDLVRSRPSPAGQGRDPVSGGGR